MLKKKDPNRKWEFMVVYFTEKPKVFHTHTEWRKYIGEHCVDEPITVDKLNKNRYSYK